MITVLRASKVCVWMDNKQYYQPSQYFVCAVHFSVSDMLLMRAVVRLVGGRVKSKYQSVGLGLVCLLYVIFSTVCLWCN